MIKILVVSDTHGDIEFINELLLSHSDYDFFLHLGDSMLPSELLTPFTSVKGNCDYGHDFPPTKRIKTKYGYIHMEHGNYPLTDEYILSQDVKIFLYGHTHIHSLRKIDDDHFVANPGSYTRPRDGSNGSYLEIFMDEKETKFNFKFL